MSIHDEIRMFIASAIPANQNRVPCQCTARPVPQQGVDELLRRLESFRPIGRTYEHPPGRASVNSRLVLNPAPWVREVLRRTP